MENSIYVAAKAIIVFEGKILIIRRSDRAEYDPGIWEFAGGKLEFGESLEECVRREVKEEAGIDVKIVEILYATTFVTGKRRQVVITAYLCVAHDSRVTLSKEHQNYMWADMEEVRSMLAKPIADDLVKYRVWERLENYFLKI